MANQPVQVVTNPQQLRAPRTPNRPVKAGTDFFEGQDELFGQHRDGLVASLEAVDQALSSTSWVARYGDWAHIKVSMSRRAIAKSHRPQKQIFPSKWTPHVGTDGIGEPIFAVTSTSIRHVIDVLNSIAVDVPTRLNRRTGEMEANPSRARCEASAIERIELWTVSDRRNFSAADAAAWLDRADSGNGYLVTFFQLSSASRDPSLVEGQRRSFRELQDALGRLSVEAQGRSRIGQGAGGMVSVGLLEMGQKSRVNLGLATSPIGAKVVSTGKRQASIARHEELLSALDSHPLVRSIALPPVLMANESAPLPVEELSLNFAVDAAESVPSRVGVIDGGLSDVLGDWVIERWGQVATSDRDESHGTFIGGLLAFPGHFNPSFLSQLPNGCELVDVDVLPSDPGATGVAFGRYYPNGVIDFMDEIESAVTDIRSRLDVRVFNFSLNFIAPGDSGRYGYAAQRLDQIAYDADVIFVVSAGNLAPSEQRPEWSKDAALAIGSIARDGGALISEPAESLYNISVSALNPPELKNSIAYGFSRYSRRGPGLRGATKPDFAHVGGSGTAEPNGELGLYSLEADGSLSSNAGTSFAAPLVARSLADLDQAIEGDVPREVLLALLVHYSQAPRLYRAASVLPIARDLIGFGVPLSAHEMLERPDSEVVLVVQSTVLPKEEHTLTFSWPDALTDGGKCRGYARLTVVARPVLAYEHGDERVRVNIDAKLMQQQADGGFRSALTAVNAPRSNKTPQSERELMMEASKWQVVKSFDQTFRGRGSSSTWKLLVEYLTRAEEDMPDVGVEFAAVLTIADERGSAPIFQQMRQHLGDLGVRTDDLRTSVSTRIRI